MTGFESSASCGSYEHPGFFSKGFEQPVCILHVKNRKEKIMANAFKILDIPFYLPVYQKVKRYKKSTATHELPLFSSYIFYHKDDHKYMDILQYSQHFFDLIEVQPSETEIFYQQLSDIKKILETQLPVQPYDQLFPGSTVRIKSGPLKGLEGIIQEERKTYRFVVNIEMLGQSITVEIDPLHLALD